MHTGIVAVLVVALFMAGCLPVLVGGLIWKNVESEEDCMKLIRHPKFIENIKNPTFRAAYEDHCGEFDETEWETEAETADYFKLEEPSELEEDNK